MKKKILIIVLLLVAVNCAFAQQTDVLPDGRLYSRYQSSEIENLRTFAPQDIAYWNWFVENGFIVKRGNPSYTAKYPALRFFDKDTKLAAEEEVSYLEDNFNIMAYDFEILPDKTNTYRIGNTGYVVNVYSASKLVEMYNKFLRDE